MAVRDVRTHHVAIVGSGIGGLACAVGLASRGIAVTVCERAAHPGGKLREIAIGTDRIDSGPTVFTMPDVFEAIFASAGASFPESVRVRPLETLARHVWSGGACLDLFADHTRSADAIGRFAGAREAQGFRTFAERARRIHDTLDASFIRDSRPSMAEGST